jgi:hypothetical protein
MDVGARMGQASAKMEQPANQVLREMMLADKAG